MSAQTDRAKVEWAVSKMAELAEEGDRDGIERINKYAYDYARGSNARKETLKVGYEAAKAACKETICQD